MYTDKELRNVVKNIVDKLYNGADVDLDKYTESLSLLYGPVLCFSDAFDMTVHNRIINEITVCEMIMRDRGCRDEGRFYFTCGTVDLPSEYMINLYSDLSFNMASYRFETGCVFLVLGYMGDVFGEIVNLPSFAQLCRKDELLAQSAADALLDFGYAAGRSDMMSSRLENVIHKV